MNTTSSSILRKNKYVNVERGKQSLRQFVNAGRTSMGKRRRIPNRTKRVPRWQDLGGGESKIRAVFPKHYSAMMVKPRGGQPVSQEAFKELYNSHVGRYDEDIPPTRLSQEQILAEAFVLPSVELMRLKRMVALRNGEMRKEPWHELILQQDEHRKLSLCFYANKAIFAEVYKTTQTMAISQVYPSTTKAMDVYKRLGFKYISWGMHKPYRNSNVAQGPLPP